MSTLSSNPGTGIPILLLASASPRRQELLQQIGVEYRVIKHHVNEVRQPQEAPRQFVLRMAREKAIGARQAFCLDMINNDAFSTDRLNNLADPDSCHIEQALSAVVLGADTIVVCENQVLGKPQDHDDAIRMLTLLAGRAHKVFTAIAVSTELGTETAIAESIVEFRDVESQEIERYWQTGEPVGKAGAYAIQGLGGVLVKKITGSYTGVVGLPLYETARLLERAGIRCWQHNSKALDPT